MILLDGKKTAQEIRTELKTSIDGLKAEGKKSPDLQQFLLELIPHLKFM